MANQNMIMSVSKRLNINDASTIKKCEEYLRVLQSKTTLKLSDQIKTTVCLDIATSFTGSSFDKETALELCSLKKSVYDNNLNNIKKILNVDKPLSIAELCVQFSCTHLKNSAENLYNDYKKKDMKIQDDSHPQYVAAAVYTACKLNNMKLSKSQFTNISRLKPTQWNALITEFEEFAKINGFKSNKGKLKKKKDVGDAKEDEDILPEGKMKNSDSQNVIEDYEVWKNRMLTEAEEAIRNGKD